MAEELVGLVQMTGCDPSIEQDAASDAASHELLRMQAMWKQALERRGLMIQGRDGGQLRCLVSDVEEARDLLPAPAGAAAQRGWRMHACLTAH